MVRFDLIYFYLYVMVYLVNICRHQTWQLEIGNPDINLDWFWLAYCNWYYCHWSLKEFEYYARYVVTLDGVLRHDNTGTKSGYNTDDVWMNWPKCAVKRTSSYTLKYAFAQNYKNIITIAQSLKLINLYFYRETLCCAVYAVVLCLSVRPSVRHKSLLYRNH